MKGIVILAAVLVSLGLYALIAWGVSVLIAFVFDYDIGFWRTVAAMFLVSSASNLVFSGIKRSD
ncbi:hypothetical protein [Paenibacillus abyssi]|uniref:Uncharacterized protein n=1 Tax=Paenibacillus abyssi TaxID=1340531 RepID=A0A917FLI6_9BACL|nr:hypothetical protein [Paenibacillus abyssi]GGF88154.1 hypothetical protein GCM10010916_01790 [Paenibacillus abyssi]